MSSLVTGSTGLLGNNLVRLLVARNERVRVLIRSPVDPRPLADLAVDIFEADLRDHGRLREAVRDVDVVYHCAGCVKIGWSDRELHQSVNVDAAAALAAAVREAGGRLVHVSTVNTLGVGSWERPADEEQASGEILECPYVTTKREGEQRVLEEVGRGLEAVVVHPGFMLGPWDWKPSSGRMILDVARRFTPFAPRGGCSVCDPRDVADAMRTAADRGASGRRYVLAGENLRYLDLWKLIARITSTRPPIGRAGPLMLWAAGRFGDVWGKLKGREPEVNSAAVGLSHQAHVFDSGRAVSELDYSIRPAEESIRDAWDWFGDNGYR